MLALCRTCNASLSQESYFYAGNQLTRTKHTGFTRSCHVNIVFAESKSHCKSQASLGADWSLFPGRDARCRVKPVQCWRTRPWVGNCRESRYATSSWDAMFELSLLCTSSKEREFLVQSYEACRAVKDDRCRLMLSKRGTESSISFELPSPGCYARGSDLRFDTRASQSWAPHPPRPKSQISCRSTDPGRRPFLRFVSEFAHVATPLDQVH